ncbi:hypothetical protein C1S86_11635 [Vibrio parahaemolyticus]|uniref:hypothetical protein n=1 Tax=Vibrio parahaemolyticus TaxID=670 RepID=UPI0009920A66|nr:hypothetical protein [Vibrio parahaemolyticus]OOQ68140.1 hypothetical protein BSR61_20580 [Vibrio parahaemolyticus]PMT76205.1 hypothetical protein C1S97_14580 [Vibrio parahaemolyticus]PMT81742.1 hypothetical protein C1S86_11635 [Vibrio parahaemolyticus]TOK10849.1 hypothetical protein CGI25_07645 [Vibrio parahaemolyticus]
MNYFIDEDQQIYAYKNIQLAKPGLQAISEEQFLNLRQPLKKKELTQARLWVRDELKWCDIQRTYHMTGDTKRAVSTLEQVNQYTIACRDYVSAEGDIGEARPVRPE